MSLKGRLSTLGSHRPLYTVRATTPGTFIAAPAKAEEMYSPRHLVAHQARSSWSSKAPITL
jgi:uncharacterized protein YfaS (alpha-2-macroglobulin family)